MHANRDWDLPITVAYLHAVHAAALLLLMLLQDGLRLPVTVPTCTPSMLPRCCCCCTLLSLTSCARLLVTRDVAG